MTKELEASISRFSKEILDVGNGIEMNSSLETQTIKSNIWERKHNKATLETGREDHTVVRRQGSHIF
jgi:hypothetical protein